MWAERARIGRDRPPHGPQAASGRLSHGRPAAVVRAPWSAAERTKKKGTVGAKRRRARMEKSWRQGKAGYRKPRPDGRPAGQKRVRMPDVSSSWFFAPNVDAAV